jgi:hypothetical protein
MQGPRGLVLDKTYVDTGQTDGVAVACVGKCCINGIVCDIVLYHFALLDCQAAIIAHCPRHRILFWVRPTQPALPAP